MASLPSSSLPPLPPQNSGSAPVVRQSVVVTDVDMTIGAMCRFMVKWVIAAIPAAIILWLIFLLIGVVMMAVFGGVLHNFVGVPRRF